MRELTMEEAALVAGGQEDHTKQQLEAEAMAKKMDSYGRDWHCELSSPNPETNATRYECTPVPAGEPHPGG